MNKISDWLSSKHYLRILFNKTNQPKSCQDLLATFFQVNESCVWENLISTISNSAIETLYLINKNVCTCEISGMIHQNGIEFFLFSGAPYPSPAFTPRLARAVVTFASVGDCLFGSAGSLRSPLPLSHRIPTNLRGNRLRRGAGLHPIL